MLIDSSLEFSVDQALTTTAASENVIDLGGDRDIGPGRPMWVTVSVLKALAGGTAYKATLQTSDDNSTYSDIASVDLSTAQGDGAVVGMPYTNKRYLRLNYEITGTGTAGSVSARLTDQEPRSWQAYPDAS